MQNSRRIGIIVEEKYLSEIIPVNIPKLSGHSLAGPHISTKGVQTRILQSFKMIGGINSEKYIPEKPSGEICEMSGRF